MYILHRNRKGIGDQWRTKKDKLGTASGGYWSKDKDKAAVWTMDEINALKHNAKFQDVAKRMKWSFQTVTDIDYALIEQAISLTR